jgi:hypothetical protein
MTAIQLPIACDCGTPLDAVLKEYGPYIPEGPYIEVKPCPDCQRRSNATLGKPEDAFSKPEPSPAEPEPEVKGDAWEPPDTPAPPSMDEAFPPPSEVGDQLPFGDPDDAEALKDSADYENMTTQQLKAQLLIVDERIKVTAWEADFIDSVCRQKADYEFSENQRRAALKIMDNYGSEI